MATKCIECGYGNELGHIFCVKCGAKLSLEHVAEDMEDDLLADRKKVLLKSLGIFVIILILAAIGVCLWPYGPVKEIDNGFHGVQSTTDMQLTALHFIASAPGGKPLTTRPPMRQNDVNAWLSGKGRCPKTKSVTIELTKDHFTCRVIMATRRFKVREVTIPELRLSYDVTGKPQGGELNLVGARIGHMPMFGPLIGLVGSQVDAVFKGKTREHEIFAKLTDIQVTEGEATLTVSP